MSFLTSLWSDKTKQVVLFSSTAIALYGYDQVRGYPIKTFEHGI